MSESVAGQNTGSTHQNLTAGESEQDARAQKLARTGVPYALNTAAAWSWRLIVVVGAVWLVWQAFKGVSAEYFGDGGCAFGCASKPRRLRYA